MTHRQFYEIRRYTFESGSQRGRYDAFVKDAFVPACGRLEIGPVGAFTATFGPASTELFVIIPHPGVESAATLDDRLSADASFQEAGNAVLNAPIDAPPFVRLETSLLRAFTAMPGIELPPRWTDRAGRIYELRTYESHASGAARRKIEMFNEGGEIDIFRRTGLAPVLFGETIAGARMPKLTYLLTFDDMSARDRAWDVFRNHPDWKTLSAERRYADTVSTITDWILKPTAYSQM
jgi:hypothetical protein